MGLVYGLVAQTINEIALPGLPLYHPPPGLVVSVLGSVIGGAVLGLLAAWPREGLTGVVLSAAVGAGVISLGALVVATQRLGLTAPILITFYTFLPRLFFYLPHAGLVRWGIGAWREAGPPPPFSVRRHGRVALITLGLAALVGGCSLHRTPSREALVAMDGLLRQADLATRVEELPEPLLGVEGFLAEAAGAYTLNWSDDVASYRGLRPAVDDERDVSLIIVRYESGLIFQCVFTPPIHEPVCTR
jgi:hypothetical protein